MNVPLCSNAGRVLGTSLVLLSTSCVSGAAPGHVFEAEAIAENRDIACYAGRGYGFAQPRNDVGGWITLNVKRMVDGTFVPDSAQLLKVPAGMPPGSYRLELRVTRWVGAKDWRPTPHLKVALGGQQFEHRFQDDKAALSMAGGVYHGDATWQWIEVAPSVQLNGGPVDLSLVSEEGNYNYLGVLVDAVRFTPLAEVASARPDVNAWQGDIAPAAPQPEIPGASGITLITRQDGKAATAESSLDAPRTAGYLVGWVRNELPLASARLRLGDGRESAEFSLAQLLRVNPVNTGNWYMICLPLSSPELGKLDVSKEWRLALSAVPDGPEVRLLASALTPVTAAQLNSWNAAGYDVAELKVEAPSAAEVLRLNIAQELAVNALVRNLAPKAVEAGKKLILWPTAGLPGGPPDIDFLVRHADRVRRAGVDGVVFAPLLRRDDKVIVMADETFSALRFEDSVFRELERQMTLVNWKGLEHSFLRMNIVDGQVQRGIGIDWFDDDAWNITLGKVRSLTRLVKNSKLAGVMLDTEEYPPNALTEYGQQKHAGTRSFKEYADQAYARGRQLAKAYRDEYPGMTVMITFTSAQLSRLRGGPVFSMVYPNSLRAAFMDGILSVDGITVTDGFEESYGYRSARDFAVGRWQMDDAARYSRNPQRYRQKMKKGFAVWMDLYKNWDSANENNNYQSPANLENTLHWALRNSDRYVWVYTESLDFFGGIVPNRRVPSPAYDKAYKDSRKPHDPNRLPS